MLTQDSRENLNDILFDNYITDDKYIKETQNIALKLKNKVYPEKIIKVMNNQLDVAVLKDYEIYFLDKQLFIISKDEKIHPNKFFTQIEIDKFETISDIDYSINKVNKMIIDECIEIIPNMMYSCGKAYVNKPVEFLNNNLLTYNFMTQRETEKRNTKGGIKERPKLYKKSIKDIRNAMLDGSYFPTVIAFNILANGFEKYEYDPEKRQLIIEIDDNSEVDLIDGAHRLFAAMDALRENPDLKQYLQINIFHMDVQAARRFILQESKKNEISKELLSYYDTENVYTRLVTDLVNEGTVNTNFMKNNVGDDLISVNLMGKYCTFDTLIKSIQDNFKLDKKDVRGTRQVKEYLIEFFNELISLYRSDFQNTKKSRETSYVTFNNCFYGFAAIAGKLYKQEHWQDKLYESLCNLIFDKTNSFWKGKGITTEKISGKQISSIYSLFIDLIPREEVAVSGE